MRLFQYITNCMVLDGDPALSRGAVLDSIVCFLSYGFIVAVFIVSDLVLRKKTKLDILIRYLCACGIVVAVLVLTMTLFVFGEEMVNLFKNLIK